MTDINELLEVGKQMGSTLCSNVLLSMIPILTRLFKISTPTRSPTSNPTIILYFCP